MHPNITIMNFKTEKYQQYTLIKFTAQKLNSIVSPEIKSELVHLNKTSSANVILDLSDVLYCDSSGLSALLIGFRLAQASKNSYVLCGLQPSVQKLISISQLDNIFEITPTLADAIKLIKEKEQHNYFGL